MFVLNVNKKCDIQWKHICWIPLSPIVIFICWRLSILQAHSKNIFFSLPKHCCIITLILEGQIVWPMGGQGLQLPGWQAQFLISFHKRECSNEGLRLDLWSSSQFDKLFWLYLPRGSKRETQRSPRHQRIKDWRKGEHEKPGSLFWLNSYALLASLSLIQRRKLVVLIITLHYSFWR